MIPLLTTICLVGTIAYYFLILKPKHDEKAKNKAKGRKDIDAGTDQYGADKYAEIIDDYPTYHRNK